MNILVTVLVVLITLKLLGVITWSWWWVLTPLWIIIAVWVLVIGVLLAGDEQ